MMSKNLFKFGDQLAREKQLLRFLRRHHFNESTPKIDLIYTQEHVQLRENLRKLIDTEVNPFVDQWEDKGIFPAHDVVKKLGRAGFLGVDKPIEYGGSGLDFSYCIAVAEELGHVNCGAVPTAIGVHSDMATPALTNFGSEDLKREFLAPSIAGDVVACVGVSEAHAGSDVAAIKTTAKTSGDHLVINGSKMWITNGCQADWMCLLANTNPEEKNPHKNKSLICLPMKTRGVSVSRNIKKLGLNCSDTAEIFFEDVHVPMKNIIGQKGMGFLYLMLQFQIERLWAVAASLLPLERAVRLTIEYARDRKLYGRTVLGSQAIQFRLAEMQTEIELLRSLLYRAVAAHLNGEDVTKFASMCKLKSGRLSREVADSCLQIWGGMGYAHESPISRMYRDCRVISIAGGSDEVMLSIICKYMNILSKF